MKSQPQNPEFRNNPEKFHPCGSCCEKTLLLGLQQAKAQTSLLSYQDIRPDKQIF